MSRFRNWSEQELLYLGTLLEANYSYDEISKILKRPKSGVKIKACRALGLGHGHKHVIKHKHLREPVMRFFLNHTAEETMKKFKLTPSEFKSIFTVGYMDPKLKHLRKDRRNKDRWSEKHYKILLQSAGILPRREIARRIKKGNEISCIKERLSKLRVASKTVNGITLTQYREAFGCDPDFYIQTKAGPTRGRFGHGRTHFKIIPWVYMDEMIKKKKLKAPKLTKQLIESMALFQNWIHEGRALENLLEMTK